MPSCSDYSIVNRKSRRIRGICTTPCSYEPYEHHAGAGFDQTIQACCVPNAKPSSDKCKPLDRDDVVRALPPEPNGVYGRVVGWGQCGIMRGLFMHFPVSAPEAERISAYTACSGEERDKACRGWSWICLVRRRLCHRSVCPGDTPVRSL